MPKGSFDHFFQKHYKSWYVNLLIALKVTLIVYGLQHTSFMKDLELKTLDYRFRLFPIAEKVNRDVVMVAIDDNSLQDLRKNRMVWPWARDLYAAVTRYLKDEGAKGVLYDMQFYEPDYDRADVSSEELDAEFASALQENGEVVLGTQLVPDKTVIPEQLKAFGLKSTTLPVHRGYEGVLHPILPFLDNTADIGIINIEPDNDGVIRRVPLTFELAGKRYPNIALAAYLLQHKLPASHELGRIPFDEQGNYLINWYGRGGSQGVFTYIRFSSLLQSAAAHAYGQPTAIREGYFRNKYVIIGATAGGLMDLKSSPYTRIMPGMEIWGTVLSNLLNHDFIGRIPMWLNLLIVYFFAFLVLMLFTHANNKWNNILVFLMLVILIGGTFLVWSLLRLEVNLSTPVLAFFLVYFYILIVSYLMEGRTKREIRKVFTRYLHPDVIEKLVQNPELVEMGGEELNATILFSDIYNFTTFSEGTTPKSLVKTLNEYFSTFTNTILDYHGLLDKYTGDGLMALFGVPIARQDHALLACQAALKYRNFSLEAARNNPQLTEAQNLHLYTRVGINSGPIIAGNIGSERRMDYTAIGDAVNLAARLEGVNKIYHTHIIISESTYRDVKEHFLCRELDFLRVKGKHEPTRIYELLAVKEMSPTNDFSWVQDYEEALAHYRQGAFADARELFRALAEGPVQDQAARTLMERCDYLLKNPPVSWDGILTLEIK